MSDYIKITDYAAKDALLTGNPAKLVKGTEIGADFDAVATAVATKVNGTSGSATNLTLVTPALGTPASGNLASCTGYPGTSALVTTGALNSGSITSGFGSIDIGTGALTAGTGTFTSDVNIGALVATTVNGNTITTGTGTLTLGAGSTLATSATNSITLTSTGATNVTLPTTGTLATLAGTEELDNKTLDSSVGKGTWTASGTWTLPAFTLGGAVSGGGNQLNNVVIGASTPLAGSFTTLKSSIQMNPSTVTADLTIPAGYNAASAGPITIGEGVTVTLADTSHWTIV